MSYTSEEKFLSGLSHIMVLFQWVGLVVNVILLIVYKDKSPFAFRHVKQALGLQVAFLVVSTVVGTLLGGGFAGVALIGVMGEGPFRPLALAGMGLLVGLILAGLFLATLILAIMGAVRGFQGQEWRYPWFGQWVESL